MPLGQIDGHRIRQPAGDVRAVRQQRHIVAPRQRASTVGASTCAAQPARRHTANARVIVEPPAAPRARGSPAPARTLVRAVAASSPSARAASSPSAWRNAAIARLRTTGASLSSGAMAARSAVSVAPPTARELVARSAPRPRRTEQPAQRPPGGTRCRRERRSRRERALRSALQARSVSPSSSTRPKRTYRPRTSGSCAAQSISMTCPPEHQRATPRRRIRPRARVDRTRSSAASCRAVGRGHASRSSRRPARTRRPRSPARARRSRCRRSVRPSTSARGRPGTRPRSRARRTRRSSSPAAPCRRARAGRSSTRRRRSRRSGSVCPSRRAVDDEVWPVVGSHQIAVSDAAVAGRARAVAAVVDARRAHRRRRRHVVRRAASSPCRAAAAAASSSPCRRRRRCRRQSCGAAASHRSPAAAASRRSRRAPNRSRTPSYIAEQSKRCSLLSATSQTTATWPLSLISQRPFSVTPLQPLAVGPPPVPTGGALARDRRPPCRARRRRPPSAPSSRPWARHSRRPTTQQRRTTRVSCAAPISKRRSTTRNARRLADSGSTGMWSGVREPHLRRPLRTRSCAAFTRASSAEAARRHRPWPSPAAAFLPPPSSHSTKTP